MMASVFPQYSQPHLSWSCLEKADASAERDLKLILSEREFRVLSGSQSVRPCYYRGRDTAGNAITVRVVADELAA